MQTSPIQWTDFTSNPIKYRRRDGTVVWACEKISPGCVNCYAEAIGKRWCRGTDFTKDEMRNLTPFVDMKEIKAILTHKPAAGKLCFLGDMTDIFGGWVNDEMLNIVFRAMVDRKDVTFQILTKRIDRAAKYFGDRWGTFDGKNYPPPPNVWIGASMEDQERFDKRHHILAKIPAVVRFASYEPLLGPIKIHDTSTAIEWGIIGGESGKGARDCDVDWIRSLVRQHQLSDVPVFVKQLGSKPKGRWVEGAELPLPAWNLRIRDGHGGDPNEWPDDLNVRQFPKTDSFDSGCRGGAGVAWKAAVTKGVSR